MIKACGDVFDLIKLKFDLSDPTSLPVDFDKTRYVAGAGRERAWLTGAVVCQPIIEVSNDIRLGLISFNNKDYFFASGLQYPDEIPFGLAPVDINGGLFVALISELELPVKFDVSTTTLEEYVLSQHTGLTGYDGHDFNDLAKYFPELFVAKLGLDYPGDRTNIFQISALFLASNSKYLRLGYSQQTLSNIIDLILCNSKILNYESIVQAMVSSQFKFAFLDFYRCLEMLYQIVYADEAYSSLGLVIDKSVFLAALDNHLGWRPREGSTLEKIFKETGDAYRKPIEIIVAEITGEGKSNSSKWLYELRNRIVHLKTHHSSVELTNKQWDKLISAMCLVINYWYLKYPQFR